MKTDLSANKKLNKLVTFVMQNALLFFYQYVHDKCHKTMTFVIKHR